MIDWTEIAEVGALPDRDVGFDQPPLAAARERRAHARAYRYWDLLRAERRMPAIADVDPAALRGFAANSVLFEVPPAAGAPTVRFIGATLATESGSDRERPAEVRAAPGTLLGELTRRLPLIATSCAPLDVEAEFLGLDAVPTLYRGVLLPFAGDDGRIGYVYGVITWKTVATAAIGDDVRAAVGSALALMPTSVAASPWDKALAAEPARSAPLRGFAQRVAAAQTWAALAAADATRRTTSLHAALSAVHDALRVEQDTAGAADEARTDAILHQVFGAAMHADDGELYRRVLARAGQLRLGSGALAGLLDRHADGMAGFVAADAIPAGAPEARYLTVAAIDADVLGRSDAVRTPAATPIRRAAAG